MKHIANRLCEALRYAGVIETQFEFSIEWLGKCRSYFSVMKFDDNKNISPTAARTLIAALAAWLDTKAPDQPIDARLAHAIAEGRGALVQLQKRLEKPEPDQFSKGNK
jgi:hypothetical protein